MNITQIISQNHRRKKKKCRPILITDASAFHRWNQMIVSAKIRGANICQENHMPKLIMNHEPQLPLLIFFVINVKIDKE